MHVSQRIARHRHDVRELPRRQRPRLYPPPPISPHRPPYLRHQRQSRAQAILGHERELPCAFKPCGSTPASVPRQWARRFLPHAETSAFRSLRRSSPRAFTAMAGGNVSRRSPIQAPANNVATRYTCFFFISGKVSSFQERPMLDGVHPRGNRHFRRTVPMAVSRHLASPVMRLRHNGVHFFLSQLRIVHRIRQRQHAARRHELDHIRAVLHLVTHRRPALIRAVAHAQDRPRHRNALRRHRVLIRMPARRTNRTVGHQHARARNHSRGRWHCADPATHDR